MNKDSDVVTNRGNAVTGLWSCHDQPLVMSLPNRGHNANRLISQN